MENETYESRPGPSTVVATEYNLGMASPPHRFAIAPWLLWVAAFYSVWAFLVFGQDRWPIVREHWGIAVAMAAGSYVAGSTPMGGGTVGFPILVLLFDQPASLGRYFSFAVQSIGMTSASIFIICRGIPVGWRLLRWAVLGSAVGTPLGAVFVAPHVSDLWTAVLFAVIWASFGVMTLVKVRELASHHGITPTSPAFDRAAGLLVGVLGGALIASLTGVGIDMLIYALLVLLLRADLKIAIPTSVILMATTSLVGICTNWLLGNLNAEVFANWLAASPIVILGAPLGAWIVTLISRTPTLYFVALLCVGQFIWTCIDKSLPGTTIALACLAVVVFQLAFHALYAAGNRMASTPTGRDTA